MPITERTVEFEVNGINVAVKVSSEYDATEKFLRDTLFLISPEVKSIPKSQPILISPREVKDMSVKMQIRSILSTNDDFNILSSAAPVAPQPAEAAPASAFVDEPNKRSLNVLLPELHDKILDIILFKEKGRAINSLRKDLKQLVNELKNSHYQQEEDAKFSATLTQLISNFRKDYQDDLYAEDFNISDNKNFTNEITEALKKVQTKALPRAKPAVAPTNSSAPKQPRIEDLLPSTLKPGEMGKFKNLLNPSRQGSSDTYLAAYTSTPNYQNLSQYISKLTDDIQDLKKLLEFCSDKFKDKHLKEFATTQHHNASLKLHKTSAQYTEYLPIYMNILENKIQEKGLELKAARNDRSKRDSISGELTILRKEFKELPEKLKQIKKWLTDNPQIPTEAVDRSISISTNTSSQPTVSPVQPDRTIITEPSTPENSSTETKEQILRKALIKRRAVVTGGTEPTAPESTLQTKQERKDSVFGEDENENNELTTPLTQEQEKRVTSSGSTAISILQRFMRSLPSNDSTPTEVNSEFDIKADHAQQASTRTIEHSKLTTNTPPITTVKNDSVQDRATTQTIESAFKQILDKLKSLINKAERNNITYIEIKEPAKKLKADLEKALSNFRENHDVKQLKEGCVTALDNAPKEIFNKHRSTNFILKFIRELLAPIFKSNTASTKVMSKFRTVLDAIGKEENPSDNQGKSPR